MNASAFTTTPGVTSHFSGAQVSRNSRAPLTTVERLKLKQQREAVMHKAEILRAGLKPKMEILDMTLEMLDNPKGMNIGALFTPQTRTAACDAPSSKLASQQRRPV